jgi:thiamine biosynthesis lipoprotein
LESAFPLIWFSNDWCRYPEGFQQVGILLRWDKKQEMRVNPYHTAFRTVAQTITRDPSRLGGFFPRTLLFLVLGLAIPPTSATTCADEWTRHERVERHMGTEFRVIVYAQTHTQANQAITAAFQRIAHLDQQFSNYRSDSELSLLGNSAPHTAPVPVKDEMWHVLQRAHDVSQRSEGAFDITIGPLSKLWRRARRDSALPDRQRLAAAREAVGYQLIRYDPQQQAVQLTQPGMLLDPGGIVKGYALDEALAAIRSSGVTRALVDGGGDVIAGDPPPDKPAWVVDIAGLERNAPAAQRLAIQQQAVATSGDLWQFVELDGQRYSHLIDPRTGIALTQRSSVTVIAPTGIAADAWASAFSVLGPARALEIVETLPEIELRFAYLDAADQDRAKPDEPGAAESRGDESAKQIFSRGFSRFTRD